MQKMLAGTLLVLLVGATAAWKVRHDFQEEQEGLLARAAISLDVARETALASAPANARVTEEEIEDEGGRLLYSFDFDVPGQGGYEVEVDAMTGDVIQSGGEDEDDDGPDDDDDGPDDDGPGV